MAFPLPTRAEHIWVCILTARCNMACSYCIQKGLVLPKTPRKPWKRYEELSGKQWVKALNDLPVRPEHCLILTGGEPTAHPDFLEIISGLEGYQLDLTSNLRCDLDKLISTVEKSGKRIHSSFHTYAPEHMSPEEYISQAEKIINSGIIENPIFSTVNLDLFPQFTTEATTKKVQQVYRMAQYRDIPMIRSEFRANHLGRPFMREERSSMECTSGWVNIAPDGEIHNCQLHLSEGRNSFGSICDPDGIKPLPELGVFFPCNDFGWCDSCHENSGTGMFRDPKTGEIFRRDPQATPMNYAKWLTPEELQEGGRRFVDTGKYKEAITFLSHAWEKSDDPGILNDLGVAFWNSDQLDQAHDAFNRAIQLGYTDEFCFKNLETLAKELEAKKQETLSLKQTDTTFPTGQVSNATQPKRILIDVMGHWGLGDLLCADALVEGLGDDCGSREFEITYRGDPGNLLYHPLLKEFEDPNSQPDLIVEVKSFTHMDLGDFAVLEGLPSLIDHMCSYGGVIPKSRKPKLHLRNAEREYAQGLDLDYDPNRPIIAICPDFIDPNRHWPRDRWQEVIHHLERLGARIVQVGVKSSLHGGLDLCNGQLSIRQVGAILERCDLFLGNNTGTFHYAQAAGTPCLTLFSLALPQRFIHDDALVVPVQADLPCINCMTLEHKQGKREQCPRPTKGFCMEAIPTKDVIAATEWVLNGYITKVGPGRIESPEATRFRAETYNRHAYTVKQYGYKEREIQFKAMANKALSTLCPTGSIVG